jgi:hypothetical protein
MGKASREKGKRGELEACAALADVWPGLERTYHQAHKDSTSPDIDSPTCPVFIEVKRQEKINVHAAMRQAAGKSLDEEGFMGRGFAVRPPVVVHRRSRGEWLVTMRAADLARLVKR